MRLIKCDICYEELDENNVYTTMDFMNYGSGIELCEKCRDVYKGFESAYQQEYHALREKFDEGVKQLREEYKELILKLRKNS